jgi:hypothetical protein
MKIPQKAAKNCHFLGQKMAKKPGFPEKMKWHTYCQNANWEKE